MTETTWTPSKLWRRMTAEQRTRAAEAFWADEQATDDQIQAVLLIAQQRKFRPKSVLTLSPERRARHLASIVNLPDALAARALVVYHLGVQREMMCTFLDALGLKHDEGLIEDDDAKPDPDKVGPAVEAIAAKYSADDVSLYLTTLVCQDPDTWGVLAERPEVMQPARA